MSRESRVLISRIIVVLVFVSSLLALTASDFFVTLITVSWGLILWLLYLLAAHLGANQSEAADSTTIIHSLTKVTAGLGAILAASAVKTYGLEQTMWGSYTFNMGGLAMGLGYTYGIATHTSVEADTAQATRSTYMRIWRNGAETGWRVVLDVMNPLPLSE